MSEAAVGVSPEDRTVYLIPAPNLAKFEAQCAALSRKAVRIGCSEIKPYVFGYQMLKDKLGEEYQAFEVLFTVEAPKINGWTFVARLDHTHETGNIIRMVPNTIESLPEHYRDCAPNCDHCRIRRLRNDTFVLRCDDTGELKQVGSTCLKDFFGHDPLKMARMAELLGYAAEAARGAQDYIEGSSGGRYHVLSIEDFCQYAALAVRLNGWVSYAASQETGAKTTREVAADMYFAHERGVTDADKALAAEALEWAQSLSDKAEKSDYEHNILVIAEAVVMDLRSCGLAASIVGVFHRNREREIARKAVASKQGASTFVGVVGNRLVNVPVEVIGTNVFESSFGHTYLYRMLDSSGNVLVWFSSKDVRVKAGAKVLMTGTVKDHKVRDGIQQTIVTRCKLV